MSTDHKRLRDAADRVMKQLDLIACLAGEHPDLHLVSGEELASTLLAIREQLEG